MELRSELALLIALVGKLRDRLITLEEKAVPPTTPPPETRVIH